MTEQSIQDWGATFKKGARTKDDVQVGIVVGTSEENILIEQGSTVIYAVPKNNVEAFDGNEVLLKLNNEDMVAYRRDA